MDCNEARPLLDASADHELPAPQAHRVQQHVDGCDACRRDSEALRALNRSIRATPYHRAPDALRARIVAGLPGVGATAVVVTAGVGAASTDADADAWDAAGAAAAASAADASSEPAGQRTRPSPQTSPSAKRGQRRFAWLAQPAGHNGSRSPQGASGWPGSNAGPGRLIAHGWLMALMIALCAAAAVVTFNLRSPASVGPFADDLVESHVRAQLSGHDIDVISTDRHTVKPWFNGRLDYAPPVEDLTASGFALEGGRLDYVAHRRVAVLVYRFGKHVIDVYVFPQTRAPDVGHALSPALSREGYALAHWDAEGMTWWAVTDAAPDALVGLETALKARLAGGSGESEGG